MPVPDDTVDVVVLVEYGRTDTVAVRVPVGLDEGEDVLESSSVTVIVLPPSFRPRLGLLLLWHFVQSRSRWGG